jgi:hypothetical protein
VITYPKIETLYDRDPRTFKVLPDTLRHPEFALIARWRLTEKIDGTNIRVGLSPDGRVTFGGRTDKAEIPPHLLTYLTATFPSERVAAAFDPGAEVVLFGEGYGEKIQSGGDYRTGVSFRLFDVRVGDWWLNAADVDDVAAKLGIQTAPCLQRDIMFVRYPASAEELRDLLPESIVAGEEGRGRPAEGIIARTDPLLFMRDGRRVMWKLKFKDF